MGQQFGRGRMTERRDRGCILDEKCAAGATLHPFHDQLIMVESAGFQRKLTERHGLCGRLTLLIGKCEGKPFRCRVDMAGDALPRQIGTETEGVGGECHERKTFEVRGSKQELGRVRALNIELRTSNFEHDGVYSDGAGRNCLIQEPKPCGLRLWR